MKSEAEIRALVFAFQLALEGKFMNEQQPLFRGIVSALQWVIEEPSEGAELLRQLAEARKKAHDAEVAELDRMLIALGFIPDHVCNWGVPGCTKETDRSKWCSQRIMMSHKANLLAERGDS